MPSEIISDILNVAPDVRCFAVGSDELARTNSERAARHVARPERRQATRNQYLRWKRQVDSIIEEASGVGYDKTLERVKSLPLDAIELAFDPDAADELIDRLAHEIRQHPRMGIGVGEQIASDSIVFIWLWNDK